MLIVVRLLPNSFHNGVVKEVRFCRRFVGNSHRMVGLKCTRSDALRDHGHDSRKYFISRLSNKDHVLGRWKMSCWK